MALAEYLLLQNLFGENGDVPSYNTVDAQITYRVPKIKTSFKLGASNILNSKYFQYVGGPTIGDYTTCL